MTRIFIELAEESAGSLEIPGPVRASIAGHAERGYPEEVVGLMIGILSDTDRVVLELKPMENTMGENRARRFTIDPLALAKAEREADKAGKSIIGFYHSHPDHPAKPSITDLEWAWPFYSYVIQSVRNGKADIMTSWRLRETESGAAQSERIFVEEDVRTP